MTEEKSYTTGKIILRFRIKVTAAEAAALVESLKLKPLFWYEQKRTLGVEVSPGKEQYWIERFQEKYREQVCCACLQIDGPVRGGR